MTREFQTHLPKKREEVKNFMTHLNLYKKKPSTSKTILGWILQSTKFYVTLTNSMIQQREHIPASDKKVNITSSYTFFFKVPTVGRTDKNKDEKKTQYGDKP